MQSLKSGMFAYGSEIYEIAESYDQGITGFAGDFEYYMYLNNIGKWIIQRHQISTGQYLYVNGSSGYSTYWSNKVGLTYDAYHKMSNLIP